MQPSNDLLALAGTLYGEIRGGTPEQRQNIAQVILNRHTQSGMSVKDVCLARKQFSCWNLDNVNRGKILYADRLDPKNWAIALDAAHAALSGANPNRIKDCTHYFAASMSSVPWWCKPGYYVILNDGASIFVGGVS